MAATVSDNGGDAHLPSLLSSLPLRSDQKQEATVAAATIRDGGGNAPPPPPPPGPLENPHQAILPTLATTSFLDNALICPIFFFKPHVTNNQSSSGTSTTLTQNQLASIKPGAQLMS